MALNTPNHSQPTSALTEADLTTFEIEGAVELGMRNRKTLPMLKYAQYNEAGKWNKSEGGSIVVASKSTPTVPTSDERTYSNVTLTLNKSLNVRPDFATEQYRFLTPTQIADEWVAASKRLSNKIDQVIVSQCIKGAPAALTQSAAAADLMNPVIFEQKLDQLLEDMEMADVDISEYFLIVNPKYRGVIMKTGQAMNFGGQQAVAGDIDLVTRQVNTFAGLNILNVAGSAYGKAIAAHELGAEYNVTAAEAKTVAVVASAQSIAALFDSANPQTETIIDKKDHNVILEISTMMACKPWYGERTGIIKAS